MRNLISSTLMLLAVASAAQADHAQDGKHLPERDRLFLGCPTYMDTPQTQPRNLAADNIARQRAPVSERLRKARRRRAATRSQQSADPL